MKSKSRKKPKRQVASIVVEAASSEIPLTAFLSLFSDQNPGSLVSVGNDGFDRAGRKQCRKLS
jgi:hypothetical protein